MVLGYSSLFITVFFLYTIPVTKAPHAEQLQATLLKEIPRTYETHQRYYKALNFSIVFLLFSISFSLPFLPKYLYFPSFYPFLTTPFSFPIRR